MTFRDSFCILPASLLKLSKSFDVETTKGVFPYDFFNKDNLNYIGKTPDIKFYNKISQELYSELLSSDVNHTENK